MESLGKPERIPNLKWVLFYFPSTKTTVSLFKAKLALLESSVSLKQSWATLSKQNIIDSSDDTTLKLLVSDTSLLQTVSNNNAIGVRLNNNRRRLFFSIYVTLIFISSLQIKIQLYKWKLKKQYYPMFHWQKRHEQLI